MPRIRRFQLVGGLLLFALLGAASGVLATTLKVDGGDVTAIRVATANDEVSTKSQAWLDVPGMSRYVSVPANQKALLVITFSGVTACLGLYCRIRVLVDGIVAMPGNIQFAGNTWEEGGSGWEAASMQFTSAVVTDGGHRVKVQYAAPVGDQGEVGNFRIGARTLSVLRSRVAPVRAE